MDISLNDGEIKQAIKNFVGTLGIDTTGKQIDIVLVAGRKEKGYVANISITNTTQGIEKTASEVVQEEKVNPVFEKDQLAQDEEEIHNPESTNTSGGSLFNND